jgi:ligand-binding sensor domain-containing protein
MLFRFLLSILLATTLLASRAQYPYVRKLNFPDPLPTQVVYDMLTDAKGYIWVCTDKGLYRFNGRTFVAIPFDRTSSKAVSYLQEDNKGVIWCMNFHNQVFSLRNDTLRQLTVASGSLQGPGSFNNMVVGDTRVWLHTFDHIYELDKQNGRLIKTVTVPGRYNQIISIASTGKKLIAITHDGFLLNGTDTAVWNSSGLYYNDFHFVRSKTTITGVGTGYERRGGFEWQPDRCIVMKPPDLPQEIYVFQAVQLDNDEFWLCTQSGAYRWNRETGETRCYLPNERVSDIVKDYQGNYWFSTLDNGLFVCASLYNSLIKIYQDPLLDNFTRIQALPNGELLTGSSQGLMARINLDNLQTFEYNLPRGREMEFISYDPVSGLIINNRGAFRTDQKEPVEIMDYSKGMQRDKFGNLIVALFNGALVINDRFGERAYNRFPNIACPLYEARQHDTVSYDGKTIAIRLRARRCLSALSTTDQDIFWIGYEDGLYEYNYDGTVRIYTDSRGMPVVARSLQQQFDGSLVVGTSTTGVKIFRKGKELRSFTTENGLSSNDVRKVIRQGAYIWVLTDAGLDRIDATTGTITNYLEEYGLSNIIINDFLIDNGKILFATTTGLLVRYNLPRYFNFDIRFPLLKASMDGLPVENGATLLGRDISFYFEALHYLSTNALNYQYRLMGSDTSWQQLSGSNNQISFNSLSPGSYTFEIRATAGPNYKSDIRQFSFQVPRPFWLRTGFLLVLIGVAAIMVALALRKWKTSLLNRQVIKEQVLKSQLVALRAQMNPHFLYNVLNTVQGLVYGNRKTEAGELLGNFSDLMRKTLQASDKQLLTLRDEIENIRLYLELEKARFDEGFTYTIDIIGIEDLTQVYVPSLMLQPFVENAVKHGLMHKAGEKKVEIVFEKEANGIRVVIDDNGIGRIHSMEINQRSQNKPFSFATEALNERMNLFNRLYPQKIFCRIVDKTDMQQQPQGTRVELLIPDYTGDIMSL